MIQNNKFLCIVFANSTEIFVGGRPYTLQNGPEANDNLPVDTCDFCKNILTIRNSLKI